LAFLTFCGKIDQNLTEAFLVRFDNEALGSEEDMVWVGWQRAITLLGLRNLSEWAERHGYQEGLAIVNGEGPKAFYEDLAETECAPDDPSRFEKVHIGYFTEIDHELERVEFDREIEHPPMPNRYYAEPSTPVINLYRDVGRNDPCPCGSGKKAKQCCLVSSGV